MLANKDISISSNNFNNNIINITFAKRLLNSSKRLFKIANNEVDNYAISHKRLKAGKDTILFDS